MITMPPDMNMRFFKLRIGKSWIHTKIKSTSELQTLIEKYKPDDVYFSVSTWVCADKVEKKYHENGKLINNIMTGSMMVIDIDAKDFHNKTTDEAFFEMLNIKEQLERLGLYDNKFVFTGGGYHIWVQDWERLFIKKKIKNAKQRYRYYEYKRRKFVNILKQKGLVFDHTISLDNHRIVRLPGTIHGKSGKLCEIILPA